MTAHGAGPVPIEVERRGPVATLWLARPAARNALDERTCRALLEALDGCARDPALRAVLLRGRGPSFCAGADTREIDARKTEPGWYLMRRNLGLDTFLAIEACPLPVVAVVHGPAVGAGGELVLAADFAVASTDAWFRWPEAQRGIGATQRLARRVGMARARDLLFTGRVLEAAAALEQGVVTRLVAPGDIEAELERVVAGLLSARAPALRATKDAMRRGEGLPLPAAVDIERELIAASQVGGERVPADPPVAPGR